jgi:hypothetical protein
MRHREGAYFCGDDQIISFPAELLDCSAHNPFRITGRVSFSTVEKVDTDVIGGFHAGESVF